MELPKDFSTNIKQLIGEEGLIQLEKAIADEATVSVRKNPWKWFFEDSRIRNSDGKVSWCEGGIYLKSRPTFTFDPLMHAGCYYVQEASSMFLAQVMKQYVTAPCTMLDLCAAPGGKSTVARSFLNDKSMLVSNEPIRNRSQILAENMTKFGHPYSIVTNNYPKDFQRSGIIFDVILADVPCSGEGMFRKDQTAIDEWSLQNVDTCWQRQREIVTDIWENLKPGGILIYSTCTFNTKENEENVKWIMEELGADIMSLQIKEEWNITGSLLEGFDHPVYRFLPGKTRGEGLFMAVIRKNGTFENDAIQHLSTKQSQKKKEQKQTKTDINKKWLKESDRFEFIIKDDIIRAIPQDAIDIYRTAETHLNIMSAGVTIGTIKGKDIIPDSSLALSINLNHNEFPSVEVNYEQAIAYLHKEAVPMPPETPRGFVILKYKNIPIGFEKNIGNRANNLYPQEWRIKSGYMPEENQCIIV
jgi:16S rRNA C967 or C1407 C5-methylase (RsmB/RsmF family)/NOL1/NOP2/fmu family ribosome biogenesis protein